MYVERRKIFLNIKYSFTPSIILMVLSIILYIIGKAQGGRLTPNDYLAIMTFSAIVCWFGGFAFIYGTETLTNAAFPLLFLILMVPIPTLLVDNIILMLQSASAEVSYKVFRLLDVPIYREGFVFHLPGLSVEVAEECSGIRSSIALFITSILAGHLFLKTGWKKVILILSIIPITIFKNGVRIVTLSLLGAYVDKAFITNSLLHKRGGIVFFILALLLLSPLFWYLRKSESMDS